jgi:hypothetical protein
MRCELPPRLGSHDLAKRIMDGLMAMEPLINALGGEIETIPDPLVRAHYRRSLGDIMSAVSLPIFDVEREFPDLNPDRNRMA